MLRSPDQEIVYRDLTATLTQILPSANNQRYTVLLNLDAPPDNLLPGETGEMNILCGTRTNALLIPTRALLNDRVWVARDGIAEPRTVKVGFRDSPGADGGKIELLARYQGITVSSGTAAGQPGEIVTVNLQAAAIDEVVVPGAAVHLRAAEIFEEIVTAAAIQ